MIVDAHLDIAFGALAEGRDFNGPPAKGYAVSRDALVGAGVGLVFPTLFAAPAHGGFTDTGTWTYRTAREAALIAEAQVGYYRSVRLQLLRTAADVRTYRRAWRPGRLAGVLLMENADPIEKPADVPRWVEMGVRIVGPAWSRTRYCGGTGAPGGLTALGRELLQEMGKAGVVLDLSHMADRATQQSLEMYRGPVIASHAGARALNPGDRQLPDGVIRAIGQRRGVVGISFFRGHLRTRGKAAPADVARHARHFATVAGGPEFVGIGSDLDGGFTAAESPIRKLEGLTAVRSRLLRDFSVSQIDGIMGENWLDFLARSLP